ncbi:maleylpyruvate isomerase family mycothiol-dependent enzyme [Streptomyces tropicalis]|uniref:Maleylpyruvate isomerase family mycothiol-dependent enzyme n=1 Tax=Streptomyces tropicalis TaxID=3034234 RepID=A0ABT6AAF5_9ACTN|nr:maleylpyruvate isomerase family mycothiol-dependent enzyme [Streptomyces tropicalis]MDF3301417.1 maleylpyruvate isomerase family mycothiol-dependent enzyme [Streptomyces tropicalis]
MEASSAAERPLPYTTHCQAIRRETARLAEVVGDVDPATAVPSCPDWTVGDLTRHVGSLQRWFCALLTRRVQEPPRDRDVELALPDSPRDYPQWVEAGIGKIAAVLEATDPQAPMWAWGEDQHARFWARRMLFETLVHRVDAEEAVGRPSPVDPALAADGIDEFLVNLRHAHLFAPAVGRLRGSGETLTFECTDDGPASGRWRMLLDTDGFRLLPTADTTDPARPGARTTVRGPAADLLLLLYGRRSYQDKPFEVTGPATTLDHWSAHTAF